MNVLVACEESQTVCKAFRDLGHTAFSCDLQDCSGGHPEWHIKCDVRDILKPNCGFDTPFPYIKFFTCIGSCISIFCWDLIIAHPPCTYFSLAGNCFFNESVYGERAIKRKELRDEAKEFFRIFLNLSCKRICIENPVGTICTDYPCTQIIQPYWFGHFETKRTCLWLKGLPKLRPTCVVRPNVIYLPNGKTDSAWHFYTRNSPDRQRLRSKTFSGIALAMASQWGSILP